MSAEKRKVWVVGHKNPDTDSICAALSYAYLKNQTENDKTYVAKRAGAVNAETHYVLDYFGAQEPELVTYAGTQIKDINFRRTAGVSSQISLRRAWETMKKLEVVTLPVTNQFGKLEGIIVTKDIATSYMDVFDNHVLSQARTQYKNIAATLDGTIIVGNEHADYTSLSVTVFVIFLLLLYVIVMVLWIVKVFMRYYNMEVQTDDTQLFFESGLITRFSSRFSYDKVCTVYVKQNILEKYLGCCTIMLKQAFNATEEKDESDVKIYGSNFSGHFLNWWLGKDYATSQTILSAKSGKGVIGYTMRFDFPVCLIVSAVLCYYHLYPWLAIPVVYMLISLLKGILAARRSCITLKEDYIEIHNGKLADIRNYIKYTNVEVVSLRRTPFTPFFHRVILMVSTNGTSFKVRSLKEKEANDVYEFLIDNSRSQEVTEM